MSHPWEGKDAEAMFFRILVLVCLGLDTGVISHA
jgi:hypothetical protein